MEEKDAKINPTNLRVKFDREADKPCKTPESGVGSAAKPSACGNGDTKNAPHPLDDECKKTKLLTLTYEAKLLEMQMEMEEEKRRMQMEMEKEVEKERRRMQMEVTRLRAEVEVKRKREDQLLEGQERQKNKEIRVRQRKEWEDKIDSIDNVTPSHGQCDSGDESAMAEGVRNKRQRIPNSPEECVGIARDSRGVLKG